MHQQGGSYSLPAKIANSRTTANIKFKHLYVKKYSITSLAFKIVYELCKSTDVSAVKCVNNK